MTDKMTDAHTQTQTQENTMTLTPPEVLTPIAEKKAPEMVPLKADVQEKIDAQVTAYIDSILKDDVQSAGFQAKLDSAFRLGKEEISNASSLMTGRFMERNFVGIENSAAFKSIQDMRGMLDDLNPGKQGDLLSQNKLLGIIPFGNKLQAYFRKFQTASSQLQTLMTQIYAARDDMQRDATEIELVKTKLWDAMQKLKGAIYFAEQLDKHVADHVESIKASDPLRAKALEQEVLFYARQNLQDMQTQMAVNVNAYLSMDLLKKTAREMVNGCNRVATTGMSAMATAQTVARATGNQIQVMEMLGGVSATIGELVTETSRQLGQHVEKTGEFAANPLIGIQKIQEMFDNTFKAMDAMDNFRSLAVDNMGKNNAMLKEQIARTEQYLDKTRAEQARTAMVSAAPEGPVKL
ncbi:toxic anion resistance protein [Undibacterium sp. Ji49W]|uniref:toxic anion resistance protein n=1 Tax=Undibacterium sp. Ji49W TaxID=3413040 RepID=UPI003BF57AD9